MRRHVAAFAVIVLSIVSAPAVHLDYAPDIAYPELIVSLDMPPGSMTDPVETTRRWITPVESAIRSLGDVVATRGEITSDSAMITVRFRRGTDAELKTARLASELAGVRNRLPRDARLSVWPSQPSGSRPSAFLAVTRATDAKRIADELRGVTGVRDVQVFGGTEIETVVKMDPFSRESAAALRDRLAFSSTPHHLGKAVFVIPSEVEGPPSYDRHSEPLTLSRLNGQPAVILAVLRDTDVPLFRFDTSLRERAHALQLTEVWSEATELRALLLRLAIGALVASLILALRGAGLYIPIAAALAINVARVTDARVDSYTLLIAAVAIAAVAPFAVLRRRSGWAVVFFALLPIATSYLAPQLTKHAIAFACVGACALLGVRRQGRRFESGGLASALQRNAFTIVLGATAAACLLLSWFGPTLDPRSAKNPAERGRLYIRTELPAGATLASTTQVVEKLEAALKNEKEIRRFWTILMPSRATTILEVDDKTKDLLRLRLQSLARNIPGSVTVTEAFGGRSGDLEERAEADEAGRIYRILLKSTDATSLRIVYEELANRLARKNVRRNSIVPEWAASTTRIELVPRPTTTMDMATHLAAQVAERTLPPSAQMLPDGRVLRVIPPGAPASIDEAPQRADVFSRVFDGGTIPANFTVRDNIVVGRVTRELGRYVLPVTIHVPGYNEEKLERRREIDQAVETMALPAGMIIERPSLEKWTFSKEKLRLLGLAAFLPLLLITTACIVLSSLRRALVACAPAILGIAVAAPLLLLVRADTDEITLIGLAAAVCGTMPVAIATVMRPTYRELRMTLQPLFLAALACVAFLTIAATKDARAPLVAAAAVMFVANGTGSLLPIAIVTSAREAKRRMRRDPSPRLRGEGARRADEGLQVRSLTKDYGTFRALHNVSFELTPGVIGLLGPNGAGKTTLLRTLTGLLTPTRGQVSFRGVAIDSKNLDDYRRNVGFLPQEFNAYSGLTGAQFLRYWMLERGVDEDAEGLLKLVGLEGHANRRVRDYSGGMRQRIGIARALIGDPPLIIVDEPTTGLDIEARASFRELMQSLGKDRIVIVSTHIASDVESTASRILLLVKGTLRWDGSPDALVATARGRVFETTVSDADARSLSRAYRVTKRVRTPQGIRVRGVARAYEPLPGTPVEPTLEEAYLAIASEGDVRLGSFSFLTR